MAYATAADLYESNKFKKFWKSSKKSKKSLQESKEFKIEEDLRGLVFKRVQQVQEASAQEVQEVQEVQVSAGVQEVQDLWGFVWIWWGLGFGLGVRFWPPSETSKWQPSKQVLQAAQKADDNFIFF